MSDPWAGVDSILFGSDAGGGGVPMTAAPGPYQLPSDMVIYYLNNGAVAVGYGIGSSLGIYFTMTAADLARLPANTPTRRVSVADFHRHNPVVGGHIAELGAVASTYGSWKKYWDWLILTHLGENPAKADVGVQRVMLELAGRPDMSPEELENRLKATSWWKKHTEAQLVWNDLSPAEKTFRINEMKARMSESWFGLTGSQADMANPEFHHWAGQIASGAVSFLAWVEVTVKPRALRNTESPWSRSIRDEQEQQRARGIDIENQAEFAQEMGRRWGVQMSDEVSAQWGKDIMEKVQSEADLLDYLKGQASTLYPNKDPELETAMWADAWLQTYRRTFERDADIFNPEIQRALQQGVQPWQFERELKQRPEWLETKNAQDTFLSEVGNIGNTMGFS